MPPHRKILRQTGEQGRTGKRMNFTYLAKRVLDINYRNMWDKLKVARDRSGKNRLFLLADMVACGLKYQAGYTEYLMFEYYRLNAAQRDSYITRGRQNDLVTAPKRQELLPLFCG